MKPDSYSLIDLIRDEDFISWVRAPDPESDARWQQFLAHYPGKREMVNMARDYVNLIAEDTGRDLPTTGQSRKMWENVQENISGSGKKPLK